MNALSGESRSLSLQFKVLLAVAGVFLVAVTLTTVYSVARNKAEVASSAEGMAREVADNYYDSLNVLMLTGGWRKAEELQKKVLSRPEITEARIIRGDPINAQYKTPGKNGPEDDLDRKALEGEEAVSLDKTAGGRVLTLVIPMVATNNTHGTNCLKCHPGQMGHISGAVRVGYSLAAADAAVEQTTWETAGISLAIFVVGLSLVWLLLRHVLIAPIKHLQSVMERVERESDLDLTVRLESRDELGSVAGSFNRMMGRFRGIVRELAGSAEHLTDSAEQMAALGEDTQRRVSRQQAETEQVATAIHEMSTTIQEVARSAVEAAQAAHEANSQVDGGKTVVEETVRSITSLTEEVNSASTVIRQLKEDSGNIGAVLNVIRGVAEQTNLLALNAAIEAARAGEQGRGFAVVADEVRTLASRTQSSTKDIQDLIGRLQASAESAVAAMEQGTSRAQASVEQAGHAGEALEAIRGAVVTINDMNTHIASAAEEQSAVAEEIHRNVTTISELGRETAGSAKQSEETSRRMHELSGNLKKLVAVFNKNKRTRFDFDGAKSAHRAWLTRVRTFLDNQGGLTRDEAVSHHHCKLGQWYYGDGLQKYGDIPEMRAVEAPHAELHKTIQEIIHLKEDGNFAACEQQYARMGELSTRIVGLLNQIQAKVDSSSA